VSILYNILFYINIVIYILSAAMYISTQGTLVLRAADYNPVSVRFDVKTIYLDLKDSYNDHEVPVKIYYPAFRTSGRPSKHPRLLFFYAG
jgi:hypothetical protein